MRTLNLLLRRSLRRSPPQHRLLHHLSSSSNTSHLDHRIHRHHDYNSNNDCHSIASQFQFSSPRHFSSQPEIPSSDEASFPQSALISLLDSFHDATGLPWWLIISASTVAMRFVLAPVTILQMKKLRRIGEVMSKLPQPFPPPGSQISFRDQMSLFLTEKKAAGCPSFFWSVAGLAIQAPCFILWIMSIRTMSLGNHSGFDCGGALWFQNLTDYPSGVWGPIFPLVVAGLHFTNVQTAFRSALKQLPGPLGTLAKFYKMYLQVLTLPLMFTAFNLPQGSLVYWLTNSSMSLIQTICLSNPYILSYLGMPKMDTPVAALNTESSIRERGNVRVPDLFIKTKNGPIAAQSLSPLELVNYSTKLLSDGRVDTAMNFLRIALEKDPEDVRALFYIGQALINREPLEALGCFESAISKLLMAGSNLSEKQLDLLIVTSQWAGTVSAKLGRKDQALLHLERVAEMDEPENPTLKAHYYDTVFMLTSTYLSLDRKEEAHKCLERVVAFDPKCKVYFKQLEDDLGDFANDLASTRRDF